MQVIEMTEYAVNLPVPVVVLHKIRKLFIKMLYRYVESLI
jgi:hypothetical protein